ncbi:VOC family protein [Streptomyces pinistramenti]|uniref:VOC family protein n=1 Tax=Streptomyces pinistramenti TaxID=2884812 RepID=UPI001D099261|nr:VOC family protein [Streptomyces pinistramenti]MCB5906279.1 4-hydroxyphenylpyruvate dioxygenase [Streptomyces pinistramenti]
MTVRDISHVELYTRDKVAAVQHFVSAMGFTRVADSVEVDRSSVLLRLAGFHLVVTSGWGTWKYVSEYGAGVADVAVRCADVAATRDAALAAGATVEHSPQGNPVVSGFGGFSHTLLPAARREGHSLPAGRRWTATPGAPSEPAAPARLPGSLAFRLPADDPGGYAAFCEEVFGFARLAAGRVPRSGRPAGSVAVRGASEQVALALPPAACHGPGERGAFLDGSDGAEADRLVFLVDDMPSAAREFDDLGVRFLDPFDAGHAG